MFQFLTGTIRRNATEAAVLAYTSFNSLLVQLEGTLFIELIASIEQFQFLTGTIRSPTLKGIENFWKVSIPYWYN